MEEELQLSKFKLKTLYYPEKVTPMLHSRERECVSPCVCEPNNTMRLIAFGLKLNLNHTERRSRLPK